MRGRHPETDQWPAIGDWGEAMCVDWPTRSAQPYLGPWTADPGITVLLIGSTHDPSTPFSNTESTATPLPRTSVLTVEGYWSTAAAPLGSPLKQVAHEKVAEP